MKMKSLEKKQCEESSFYEFGNSSGVFFFLCKNDDNIPRKGSIDAQNA